ncbi:aconitate hydratase AcnA [Anaerobacillus sp. MEB173]|uniref:aconitate hydratase AcnA n=1 Tax=Anaerobacillus sp. MEB173 TaxID=3383345 RepID=UPI003F8DDE99
MVKTEQNILKAKSSLQFNNKNYTYYGIKELEDLEIGETSKLPYSIKVILESALREFDGKAITKEHIFQLANWANERNPNQEVPFKPGRVLLHDTTGVPAIVDLAALREAMYRVGGDVSKINPLIPVDLIVDHSVTVDYFGSEKAKELNEKVEFDRNEERFRFLRWAQSSFNNFRVFPPSTGIMHQINLEFLATVASIKEVNGETVIYPDSLVGTDSHTTMINGLGIVGYGVGGIEAEAGMLGQPIYTVTPEVVGFKLTGKLNEGSTATDLALTITNMLRKKGVIGKFVEFYGPGIKHLTVFERSTISNMAPEYGATMGLFPVDQEVLNYLEYIGRSEEQIRLVETYYKTQGMFYSENSAEPVYSDYIELDLSSVVPCLAGPKRPQDRIDLDKMKQAYLKDFQAPINQGGFGLTKEEMKKEVSAGEGETKIKLRTGDVVLAAITSCTNTSNPNVLIGAGLLAKKALEKGLKKPSYVKSSLTPGSRVVTDYLQSAGLIAPLEAYGFHVAGYGCATCIGNSGPLPDEISNLIADHDLTVASVVSGNRNFEGRIHPQIKANYLASPPLVVAYALAGTVNIDLTNDPIGYDNTNKPVYLKDIWPTSKEIEDVIEKYIRPELFNERYQNVLTLNKRWDSVDVPDGQLFDWDGNSTYIQEPPFLKGLTKEVENLTNIVDARALALLGDSVTTDHLSPSGAIKVDSVAGQYLAVKGVEKEYYNSYPSRRGNHEVMIRGALANHRIRNQIVPGIEGGYTKYTPTGEIMSMYDASLKYKEDQTNLVIIAGKEYGTGSSRDWAAKGPYLLGVKAIIAESFERIHRSNLVGMGVLPLQFVEGTNAEIFGLTGLETYDILGINNELKPGQTITVKVTKEDGSSFTFDGLVRLDSVVEVEYYRNGGIMQTVLKQLIDQ